MTLESDPAAQTTHLGADVWRLLLLLAERGRLVHLQWVPAHCGVAGTERADTRAYNYRLQLVMMRTGMN